MSDLECGTRTAYLRHLERGEPVDDACRIANNRYQKNLAALRARVRALTKLKRLHHDEWRTFHDREMAHEPWRGRRAWDRARSRADTALKNVYPDEYAVLYAIEYAKEQNPDR